MGEPHKLVNIFQPARYDVHSGVCRVTVRGSKLAPPSKRITLHQRNLKIITAKVTRIDKKGRHEYEISRIIHLRKREQVRLHTFDTLLPGNYELVIDFQDSGKSMGSGSLREEFPCIDEPEAWSSAEIVYS